MKLLYAEDEKALSEAVTDVLKYSKYTVDAVYNGRDAYDYAKAEKYDGIILDIMMPGMSGLEVLKRLRAEGNNTPVMLLTAKGETDDRITGFDAGADDYLPKPFNMKEFLSRVRAMLRRKEEFTPEILTMGNISLNMHSSELVCGDNKILLPKLEYQLLELLMLNRGICLSSETILVKLWGYDTDSDLGVVWVYISYLRKKLESVGANVSIKVKRNIGYILEETND